MRCKTITFSIALAIGLSSLGTPASAAPLPTVTSVSAATNFETVAQVAAVTLPAAKAKPVKVTTSNLHLRAKANANSRSLKVVPKNTKLTIQKVSGKWHQVSYKGKKGWVSGKFLKTAPVVKKKQTIKKHSQVVSFRWTTSSVNVRTGAGTQHRSLGVVRDGEKVSYLSSSNGWSKVKTSKGTGWIKATYLSKSAGVRLDTKIVKINSLVKARYGSWVYGYGGIRAGSAGHSSGNASDLMIHGYKSATGQKRGDTVAKYLIANRKALGISYLIWDDKIWFPSSGWGPYSKSDRWGKQFTGKWNDTTKHLDHIHVEVR